MKLMNHLSRPKQASSRRSFGAQVAASTLALSYFANTANAASEPDLQQDAPSLERKRLSIGFLIYPKQDQIDFTGPFEVLSRMPDAEMHIIAKSRQPIRDIKGLILTPETTIAEAPALDLLVVSGGLGQQALMADEEVLAFLRKQAESSFLLSVCTGALLCGAAGLLRGRRATTHWAAWDLLPYYGAIPVKSRVVTDGRLVTSAGVTAGLDGALTMAAILRGRNLAERIQLEIEYAPDPPFHSGTPETAAPEVLDAVMAINSPVKKSRESEARRFARNNGVAVPVSQ